MLICCLLLHFKPLGLVLHFLHRDAVSTPEDSNPAVLLSMALCDTTFTRTWLCHRKAY